MMILFVKLTKGIGHKFCQLMKSSLCFVAQHRRFWYAYPRFHKTPFENTMCITKQHFNLVLTYN